MKPLFRWAGAKTRIVEQLDRLMPSTFDAYAEPFCGSAALYFHLLDTRFAERISPPARLNDVNRMLAGTLQTIATAGIAEAHLRLMPARASKPSGADTWAELAARLMLLSKSHGKRGYKREAAAMNRWLAESAAPSTQTAATFLYLLGTNFNGLWRVNKAGAYNVPIGRPRFAFDLEALLDGAAHLSHASITHGSWINAVRELPPNTFAYFDPPYFGAHSAYDLEGFSLLDHAALAMYVRRASHACMVSLPDSWVTRDLYKGQRFSKLSAQRSMSSKASTRGDAAELVVRNY